MKERLLGPLARRWRWFATVLGVQERFDEVHGGYLASAVTLASFTSLFPLLLVTVGIVGFLSVGRDLPGEIISRLGLTGDASKAVLSAISTAQRSRKGAIGFGTIGLLWSGLGVVAALQYAFDKVWQVSGRGIKDKAAGLLWLVGSIVIFAVSLGLTAILNITPWLAPVSIVAGLGLNVVLWLWTLRVLVNVDVPLGDHLRAALVGAVGLEVLKVLGSILVPRMVASSSGLYGSIGVVFAVLAWLFFLARLAVYVAVVDVTRWERKHGTVTVQIDLPKHPETVSVEANRSGEAMAPAVSAGSP